MAPSATFNHVQSRSHWMFSNYYWEALTGVSKPPIQTSTSSTVAPVQWQKWVIISWQWRRPLRINHQSFLNLSCSQKGGGVGGGGWDMSSHRDTVGAAQTFLIKIQQPTTGNHWWTDLCCSLGLTGRLSRRYANPAPRRRAEKGCASLTVRVGLLQICHFHFHHWKNICSCSKWRRTAMRRG